VARIKRERVKIPNRFHPSDIITMFGTEVAFGAMVIQRFHVPSGSDAKVADSDL
jgi:hypothetical protein